MTIYSYRTMIVPSMFQQLAQSLCEYAAEGDAGKGMFTTGISPNGASPPTHYISSGYIEEKFTLILPLIIIPENEEGEVETIPGNAGVIEEMATQAGIVLPPGTITSLLSEIDVSTQDPFVAMARLGLSIVQQESL